MLGVSPSKPLGVNYSMHFGANSIYEYDAEDLVEGAVEVSA